MRARRILTAGVCTLRSAATFRGRATLAALAVAIVAGALTLFRAEALPPVIDLDSTSAGLTVYGDDANDASGYSVAAGDIDGDTTDDLIIGAAYADPAGGDRAGETYVIYGGGSLPATIDLDSTSAGLTVYGDDANDESGYSVAAGDIDGDTTDDLIIGAAWADPAGGSGAGETYVIYGGGSLPATIDLSSTSAGLTVYGDDVDDYSGFSVAAGDIDGDTTDDLIIGAFGADPAGGTYAGETYVIYGGPSLPATIDLNSTGAGLTVYGDDAWDESGYSVAAGDIDGDTTDDLIIGAHYADPAGGGNAGETYVIYGGPSLPATIDLNSASAGLTVYGDDTWDNSGHAVAAGDIDGDTTEDLIIGALYADPAGGNGFCDAERCQAGETYVIYGGPSLPATIDLNGTSADLTVYGDDYEDWSGASVAAGDIDGDTTDDLIIGAYRAAPPGGAYAGETYVIYGGPSLPATIDLDSTSAGLTVYGHDVGDYSGYSVAAGDIDGDTTDDLIIGAMWADPAGGADAGESYVIFAKQPPPGDTDGDGCTDEQENGPDENQGGRRDYLYFWDFYDVWTHPPGDPAGWERNKVLNLFDILGVAARFGSGPPLTKEQALAAALTPPTAATGYHAAYDRGAIVGEDPWDRAPPDGAINIPDDILGVARQFGHRCV